MPKLPTDGDSYANTGKLNSLSRKQEVENPVRVFIRRLGRNPAKRFLDNCTSSICKLNEIIYTKGCLVIKWFLNQGIFRKPSCYLFTGGYEKVFKTVFRHPYMSLHQQKPVQFLNWPAIKKHNKSY